VLGVSIDLHERVLGEVLGEMHITREQTRQSHDGRVLLGVEALEAAIHVNLWLTWIALTNLGERAHTYKDLTEITSVPSTSAQRTHRSTLARRQPVQRVLISARFVSACASGEDCGCCGMPSF
jgi:hypothetical protein